MSEIEPLDGTLFGPDQPCYGCGPAHPHGFRLRFEKDGDDIVTRTTPTLEHQGAPGIMHGGLVYTIADEVAAWAIIGGLGKFGFTVSSSGKYRRAARVGVELEARAHITKNSGRIVDIRVGVTQEGEPVFEGEFRFAILDQGGAEKLLGAPLPADWVRFSR
jgi:acyl-coenzyme A thioesterase PaaI-like protein